MLTGDHRIYMQYDCTYDQWVGVLSSKENPSFPGSAHIRIPWRQLEIGTIPKINKVVYFLGNWHKFADTPEEDLLFEQACILPEIYKYQQKHKNEPIRRLCVRSHSGLHEIPLELVMGQ